MTIVVSSTAIAIHTMLNRRYLETQRRGCVNVENSCCVLIRVSFPNNFETCKLLRLVNAYRPNSGRVKEVAGMTSMMRVK